jgi:hypothetical protein
MEERRGRSQRRETEEIELLTQPPVIPGPRLGQPLVL